MREGSALTCVIYDMLPYVSKSSDSAFQELGMSPPSTSTT